MLHSFVKAKPQNLAEVKPGPVCAGKKTCQNGVGGLMS